MLDLNELAKGRFPAITPGFGKALAEAAGVCLESQGHIQGVHLRIVGYTDYSYELAWPEVTEQVNRTWNDSQEATEYGAMGIAVLLAKEEIGYLVIQRARKGTGVDYWLGEETDRPLFQRKAKLEISGILKVQGNDNAIERAVAVRVSEKLRQASRSSDSLPIYVIVVEFGMPLAEIRKEHDESS